MIPLHVTVKGTQKTRKLNVEILDLAPLTPQAVLVVLFQALLQNNESTAETSYHLTGSIDMDGYPPAPLDLWAPATDNMPAPMMAALETGEKFSKLYSNSTRRGTMRSIDLNIEAIPRRIGVELQSARLISGNIVHAGDTVMVEATVRPWQQTAHNVRIPITLPSRLEAGNVRVLVSDASVLDRTLDQPRMMARPVDMESVLSQVSSQHRADRIYVSLLVPEAQAGMEGKTLSSLPISIANALESLRAAQDVSLNGESAEVAGEAPAGGVLNGFPYRSSLSASKGAAGYIRKQASNSPFHAGQCPSSAGFTCHSSEDRIHHGPDSRIGGSCGGAELLPRFEPGDLAPHDVEIKISHCGICHSDLHLITNDWGISQYPFIPGHEIIGNVAAVGEAVRSLRVGQRGPRLAA